MYWCTFKHNFYVLRLKIFLEEKASGPLSCLVTKRSGYIWQNSPCQLWLLCKFGIDLLFVRQLCGRVLGEGFAFCPTCTHFRKSLSMTTQTKSSKTRADYSFNHDFIMPHYRFKKALRSVWTLRHGNRSFAQNSKLQESLKLPVKFTSHTLLGASCLKVMRI